MHINRQHSPKEMAQGEVIRMQRRDTAELIMSRLKRMCVEISVLFFSLFCFFFFNSRTEAYFPNM